MKKTICFCLILLALTACTAPSNTTEEPVLNATQLMQTAVHLATADALQTQAAVPTRTETPLSTATRVATLDRTRPPAGSPTPELTCDRAAAGRPIDVTIPDGTVMVPGERFSKTWRLKNVGSCTWTRLYKVSFFSGNSLNAIQENALPGEVKPGDVVDLTVDMEAPQKAGAYQSNWMLTNADGHLFGIGPNGDAPFWVQIEVVQSVTNTPQPTPSQTNTPEVYLKGEAGMGDGDQLDLDSGALNPDDLTKVDFVYQYEEQTRHVLTAMNGALWVVYGEAQPTLSHCQNAPISGKAISFIEVPAGTYICYRTSGALPGRLKIEGFETEQLAISYLTWAVP